MLWIKYLLKDLGYINCQPMKLFCDNQVARAIAHNPVQHDITKHVEIDRVFIKEKIDGRIIEILHIRTKSQIVDILTKAVSRHVFERFLFKLGMCDIYSPT